MDIPARRINIRLSATLTFEGTESSTPAISVNLSETGVLVQAGRQAERGTLVKLEFKEFKAKGEVIWIRAVEDGAVLLGMKFVSIGRRDRKFIRDLVEAVEY